MSHTIDPRPAHLGGGYHAKIYDCDGEVAGCVVPLANDPTLTQEERDIVAWDEAQDWALANDIA